MTEGQKSFEDQAADWKAAALYFRSGVKESYSKAREMDTPQAYRQALVEVRGFQDNLEEYVSLAVSVKGAFGRAAVDAQVAYDEAWAAEVDRDGRSSVRREMEGPRERYARHDVKVFGPLRQWRQAEKLLSLASEVLDEMWLRHRAVNATREDLQAILRAYAFESSLDRLCAVMFASVRFAVALRSRSGWSTGVSQTARRKFSATRCQTARWRQLLEPWSGSSTPIITGRQPSLRGVAAHMRAGRSLLGIALMET